MDPILEVKTVCAIGIAVAVVFVLLGTASIGYFFTQVYNGGPDANSTFGFRYVLAGGSLIFVAAMVLWKCVPMFIPLKQPLTQQSLRACPYCGALINDDDEVCKKCKHTIQDAN
jgi:hypothetical protein